MRYLNLTRLLWTTVTVFGFPLSSYAVTLTDPYFQGEVSLQANGNDFDTSFSSPTTIDETRTSPDPTDPVSASTVYSMTAAPLPGLADTSSIYEASAGSTGEMGYEFSIVGPSGLVPVTISFRGGDTISGNFPYYNTEVSVQAGVGTVVGTGPSFSDAYSVAYANFTQFGSHTLNGVTTPITANLFNTTDSVNLTANAVYSVGLQMTVLLVGGIGSASAYVDPLIQIAPGFANASQYSIELSPGIGNSVSAVPFPASAWLMLSGLVGVGVMARKRRRIAA